MHMRVRRDQIDEVVAAGGEMVVMSAFAFGDTAIPAGRNIRSWSWYKPALEADVLIDVPVAKHHAGAAQPGDKNLLGSLELNGPGLSPQTGAERG